MKLGEVNTQILSLAILYVFLYDILPKLLAYINLQVEPKTLCAGLINI